MPKRSIGLTIFGVIFILWGIAAAISLFISYVKFSKIWIVLSAIDGLRGINPVLKYFLITIVPFILAVAVSYIITGIGILGLRYWGWYLARAAAFCKLFSLVNPGFIFGWQVIGLLPAAIQLGLLIFVFSFFRRRKIKEQFVLNLNRFRFKSWYGIMVIFYLILPIVIPLTAIAFKTSLKLKTGQPFLSKGLPKLELKEGIENLAGLKRREIFNLSFLAPQDFILRSFNKTGTCTIWDSSPNKRGWIILWDKLVFDDPDKMYRKMKFKNTYEFEKALYSNNWGVMLSILREIAMPAWNDMQIRMFETGETKGFIKSGQNKDRDIIYGCSIYDKSKQGIGEIDLILNSQYFTKEEALRIISSLKILKKPQRPAEYYQKGLRCLAEGDRVSAQMAFAQAYYLSPQNAEYAYSLAKTLPQDDERSLALTKQILGEALKLKPDYTEAQSLLEVLNKKK